MKLQTVTFLEHLNITRLSKRCNDKNFFFKYQFFLVKIQQKSHKTI